MGSLRQLVTETSFDLCSAGLLLLSPVVAVLTAGILLGSSHLLWSPTLDGELEVVDDEKGRLESTHSLVRLLCGLAAHGASHKVLASLDLHREVGKAVVTERVETGQ